MAGSTSFLPNVDTSSGVSSSNQTSNTQEAGKSTTTGTQSGNQQTAQQNTYQPFQQQLQKEAADQAGQYLQTGVAPGTQASLDAQTAAYEQNFKQNVEPQLAAQYGAGSPAIASAESQGLVNLTSDVFQNQGSQFNSALGTAGGLAFNATGNTGEQAQTQQSAGTNDWQQVLNQQQNLSANALNLGTAWSP